MKLGVNIDHIATVRQARKTYEPDPVYAAAIAQHAGAACITFHLREDRRHIQDRDVFLLKQMVTVKLNMEMALSKEIIAIALLLKPHQITLVPEKRDEVTTEGGLDVISCKEQIHETVKKMHEHDIAVSVFIDPEKQQIEAAAQTGAAYIELHTGCFANALTEPRQNKELTKLIDAGDYALRCGLRVNAGHGLNYINVVHMQKIPGIEELNIGHSIISRAVFTGLEQAVKDMLALMHEPAAR